MKRTLFVCCILALATLSVGATEQVDPRFEFLKNLEGSWNGDFGDEMGAGVVEFHLTAGGSAIEEREMLGTPMEMVTLYHMDGADLVGTHYCMLGNRPNVKTAAKVVDRTLTFACNGIPGGAKSHDEQHIHGWSMSLDDAGQLYITAEMLVNGKVTETPTTVLTRR